MQPGNTVTFLDWLSTHLLSVGQMCDSACAVKFTANKVTVTNGATTILTVQRDKESGLWRVPIGNSTSAQTAHEHFVHNVYEQKSIKYTLHTYMRVVSDLCKTLGSRLFKMDIFLQHGHL
jgi:hypothetical protein